MLVPSCGRSQSPVPVSLAVTHPAPYPLFQGRWGPIFCQVSLLEPQRGCWTGADTQPICSSWPGWPSMWDPVLQGSPQPCRVTLCSLLLSQPLFGHLPSSACLQTALCSSGTHGEQHRQCPAEGDHPGAVAAGQSSAQNTTQTSCQVTHFPFPG